MDQIAERFTTMGWPVWASGIFWLTVAVCCWLNWSRIVSWARTERGRLTLRVWELFLAAWAMLAIAVPTYWPDPVPTIAAIAGGIGLLWLARCVARRAAAVEA